MRDDRDRQVTHVQDLTAEVLKFKESTGKSCVELDNLTIKTNALEVCYLFFVHCVCLPLPVVILCAIFQEICSSQSEQIQILQQQLAAANEKLKVRLMIYRL